MDLTLTPIGTSPAWYNPGEPNSGFVLDAEGFRVLIDCGGGVISRYLELYGPDQPIDAVVISHVHADHCFDLVPLKFGIDYGSLGKWRPQLWLPPNARNRLTRMVSMWDESFDFFTDTFDVREYGTGRGFQVGPFACSAMDVPHYIESCALRFEQGGTVFGYTGDLGPNSDVAPFLAGADLVLAEAAFSEDGPLDLRGRGHITATEAAEIARDARAHSLLLTHIPVELGQARAVEAAFAAFDGPVAAARSGETYVVARRLAAAG